MLYNGIRGNLGNVWRAFKTKSGKGVVLAAIIGGPIGMTEYVLAVNYMGLLSVQLQVQFFRQLVQFLRIFF